MFKRTLLYVVVMLILLGLFYSAGQWDKGTALLGQFADEISIYTTEQAKQATSWADANAALSPAQILEANSHDYTVLWHKRDSILRWSNTKVIPAASELRWLAEQQGNVFAHFSSGDYLALVSASADGTRSILIPIKYALNGQEPSRQKISFPASAHISPDLQIQSTPSDNPIVVGGKALCYAQSAAPLHLMWLQWLKFAVLLLFMGVFLRFLGQLAVEIAGRAGWTLASAFVLLAALGLIFFNYSTAFTQHNLGALPIFKANTTGSLAVGHSIGDWLLHLIVSIWAVFFLHRAWPKEQAHTIDTDDLLLEQVHAAKAPVAATNRFPKAIAFNLLLMLSFWAGAWSLQRLVFSNNQAFDFDSLLTNGLSGFAVLTGLVALMVTMFLFAHRLALGVHSLELDSKQRYTAVGIAAVVFAVVCLFTPGLSLGTALSLLLFGLVAALLFDIYVSWENGDFSWMLCWLLLYALFCAVYLHQYNEVQDARLRQNFAAALAEERDSDFAEKDLPALYADLNKDSSALENRLKPWPFKANVSELDAAVNQYLLRYAYLFKHYRVNVFAFDKDHQPLLLHQAYTHEAATALWNAAKATEANGKIRYGSDAEGKFRYLMPLSLHRMGDPTQAAELWVALEQEYPAVGKTYDQLFYGQDFKNMSQLGRYDYALQRNGKRIAEQGRNVPALLSSSIEAGQSREERNAASNRVDAIAKSTDGKAVAVVGRSGGGWEKVIYLFAILFTLASILLFGMAFFNSYLHFLPETYQYSLSAKGSLAKRIHVFNVSLLAISFVVVGFLTYRYFTDTAKDNEMASADFRAEAMFANLKNSLLNKQAGADSLKDTESLARALHTMANSLSADANLFDASGNLLYSSKMELAQAGLIPSKMNRLALTELNGGIPESTVNEQSAGFRYESKYLPLHDSQNRITAFLGVPHNNVASKIGSNVAGFIGMLASLYVFLLLVAFAVTYKLSRSIIKPLMLLAEKVKLVKLEDKNESLHYAGDAEDEVSDLIVQYNKMVDKLEASKVQMVRLEREGAWREMARQVAHDIKNPLTTMKLSMQQLERVSNNPEQAAAYLRKAITRLIEQIDSLAQIASEFSMFANLDIRNKSDVVINEVVENVHYLFSEQKNVDLNLSLPNEKLHIMGDKNHLIRVFNNLIINAIQAIPSDRLGKIRVSLSRDGEMAVLKISDNGGGIPPEIRERVFEPNFTTKTSGSGLGLAICKKIIEAHDGDIRFETRDNEGTDFFVEIPVVTVGLQMKFP